MLYLFVVFLLVALGRSAAPQCLPYTTICSSICTRGGVNGTLIMPHECPGVEEYGWVRPRCSVCRSGFFCEEATGSCRPNTQLEGWPCESNEQCQPFTVDRFMHPLVCNGTMCVKKMGIGIWGDSCTSSAQCESPLTCQSGECRNPGVSCDRDVHCPADSQCNEANTCVSTIFNGVCTSDDQCTQSQVCNPVNNLCVNTFSLSGDCSDSRARDYGCAAGTTCTVLAPETRQCVSVSPTPSSCNPLTQLECNDAFACECNVTSGIGVCIPKQFESRCALAWRQLQRCAEEEGCRSETPFAYPETCVAQRCPSEFALVIVCEDPYDEYTESPNCDIAGILDDSGSIVIPTPSTGIITTTGSDGEDDTDAASLVESFFF